MSCVLHVFPVLAYVVVDGKLKDGLLLLPRKSSEDPWNPMYSENRSFWLPLQTRPDQIIERCGGH